MGGVKEKSWGQCDQKIRGNIQNEEITREAQLHATVPSVLHMLTYNLGYISGPHVFEASALST